MAINIEVLESINSLESQWAALEKGEKYKVVSTGKFDKGSEILILRSDRFPLWEMGSATLDKLLKTGNLKKI